MMNYVIEPSRTKRGQKGRPTTSPFGKRNGDTRTGAPCVQRCECYHVFQAELIKGSCE